MGENLKEKIQEDFKKAFKERNEIKISTLKLLKAAIFDKEKKKRYEIATKNPQLKEDQLEKESQLSDEEIIKVILSEIKKREEAILEFKKGKREDLVKKEESEIEILKSYLPKMLSEKEIEKLAKKEIAAQGAKELKDMGKVMKSLVSKLKGKADLSLVSKIVRQLLSKK